MLEIRHLQVRYGAVHAINDVSMTVSPGELIAVLGPNAAGKSSLLRTISGLLRRQSSGSILWNGREILGRSPQSIMRAGVFLCPEGRQLFNQMSVEENLAVSCLFRRDGRKQLEQDREWVHSLFPILHDRRKQKAGTLSGGEQQMVAIAQGLLASPQLLMLDEPALGLAPKVAVTLFATIHKLAEEGLSILLIEQNARIVLDIADRAYLLRQGTVVAEGSASELSNQLEQNKQGYFETTNCTS